MAAHSFPGDVRSHLTLTYSRRFNWFALAAIPLGYLPPAFRICVEAEYRCEVEYDGELTVLELKSSTRKTVVGSVPDPELASLDPIYREMEFDVLNQATTNMARRVVDWAQHHNAHPEMP